MPDATSEALAFLLTRRSRPVRILRAPAPGRDDLAPLLTAALRVPDHGKLEPWRLVVLGRGALDRLAALAATRASALGMTEDAAAKGISQFSESPLAVAVIFSPKDSEKVPEIEQLLSAGAVALSLLNAALAAGWGAAWLTGWPAHDAGFGGTGLGLGVNERIVGFVHIGTCSVAPPERPRPDMEALTTWLDA